MLVWPLVSFTLPTAAVDCGLLKTEMYAACAWGGRIRRFADHYEYTTCEHNLLNRLAIGKREHITGKCNGVPRASAFRWHQYRDPERMKLESVASGSEDLTVTRPVRLSAHYTLR